MSTWWVKFIFLETTTARIYILMFSVAWQVFGSHSLYSSFFICIVFSLLAHLSSTHIIMAVESNNHIAAVRSYRVYCTTSLIWYWSSGQCLDVNYWPSVTMECERTAEVLHLIIWLQDECPKMLTGLHIWATPGGASLRPSLWKCPPFKFTDELYLLIYLLI